MAYTYDLQCLRNPIPCCGLCVRLKPWPWASRWAHLRCDTWCALRLAAPPPPPLTNRSLPTERAFGARLMERDAAMSPWRRRCAAISVTSGDCVNSPKILGRLCRRNHDSAWTTAPAPQRFLCPQRIPIPNP